MTFSIDYCPPWDWFNEAMDEAEWQSIEELERVLDAGYLDA